MDRLRQSLLDAPIIEKDGYHYFVHPISDGVPMLEPELLREIVIKIIRKAELEDVDKIVTPAAMGIHLSTAVSLMTDIPLVVIRKRQYGLEGEVSLQQVTGYSESEMYVNDVYDGDRVLVLDDVLSNVTQEVRQLERLTERSRVRSRNLGLGRLHHVEHHVPDRDGGSSEVLFEVGVSVVPVDRDVHLHGVHERVHLAVVDVVPVRDGLKRRQHWVVSLRLTERRRPDARELCTLLVRRFPLGVVDDLVGDSKEGVQHVGRLANALGEESRRDVERLASSLLDRLARSDVVGGCHGNREVFRASSRRSRA